MSSLQVFDPAMCCSSGVCGPDVDPQLVRFGADLKTLAEQGVTVERYNLAQTPIAFAENEVVRAALTEKGEAALPLILLDGKVVFSGSYPTREELAGLIGSPTAGPSLFTPAVAELVAIGAAIAANCEPCLRYHANEAEKLGISGADIARAVAMAVKVKDAPHQAVLRLATKLAGTSEAPVGGCCGPETTNSPAASSKCCG